MNKIFVFFLILILSSCSDKFIAITKTNEPDLKWMFVEQGKTDTLGAKVPGCVITDLFSANRIPDPLTGMNERSLQWISEKNWEYTTSLFISDSVYNSKYVDLIFEGIDTYSDIFLNGEKIVSTENMFREYRIPVKSVIRNGTNSLKVIFYSPSAKALPALEQLNYTLPGSDSLSPFIRKAAFQFGWDWSPKFVTSGIWLPVKLEAHGGLYISDVYVTTLEVTDTCAWMNASVTTYSEMEVGYAIVTVQDAIKEIHVNKGKSTSDIRFPLFNPELWWPNGYGKQPVYDVKARVFVNNYLVDSAVTRTGICTSELIQQDDSYGRSFTFKINGKPLFIKGANYVPQSVFLTDVTSQDYFRIIQSAKAAGINMLRIWGGGIYERDLFYDLCDDAGIMIWQDFMFAGSMYPGDSAFLDNVEKEVTYQIKRLRNHPSLVLWCGNNELDVAWNNWGWQKQFGLSVTDSVKIRSDYKLLFEELIPALVYSLNGRTNYIPSSPLSNWGKKENFSSGNMHYWGVWHGDDTIDSFAVNVPRFMTEYGMQSYPSYKALKKSSGLDRLTLNGDFITSRQKSYKGNSQLLKYINDYFGNVGNAEDLSYLSQLNQAEAMRIAIESHRLHAPLCMGSMFWQLNDVWDGASWSTIEHSGKWKAAQYHLKRLYARDIILHSIDDDTLRIFFQTESFDGVKAIMSIDIMDLKGRVTGKFSRHVNAEYLNPDKVFEIPLSELLQGNPRNNILIVVSAVSDGKLLCNTNICLDKPVNLELSTPVIQKQQAASAGAERITLKSDVFVKGVYLYTESGKGDFSDNYFDLIPGKEKTVSVTGTEEEVLIRFFQ